jgi:hypothetical protein
MFGWTCRRPNACVPPPCGSQVATRRSGFLAGMLDGLRAELIPGLRNAGLLATQELKAGVPQRTDRRPATERRERMLACATARCSKYSHSASRR